MAHMYFDESIRDNGSFIVGALVVSQEDLSIRVTKEWRGMGLDANTKEFKSSTLKAGNPTSQLQRDVLRGILQASRLGLVVCPSFDRGCLGEHAIGLVSQLLDTGVLENGSHELHLDEGITLPNTSKQAIRGRGVSVNTGQDSRIVTGIQVADHAAYTLGVMLLEEAGIISKSILAGANSGYEPDLEIELGFELWADLRYTFFGEDKLPGDSSESFDPHRIVEGFGLCVAPSCDNDLADLARRRFGSIYLGCIH